MKLALGSSILNSLIPLIEKKNKDIKFICKKGGVIDIKDFMPDLLWYQQETVSEIFLLYLGGNNCFSGKSVRMDNGIHYHQHRTRKSSTITE